MISSDPLFRTHKEQKWLKIGNIYMYNFKIQEEMKNRKAFISPQFYKKHIFPLQISFLVCLQDIFQYTIARNLFPHIYML